MRKRKQIKHLFPINQSDWTDDDYEAAIPENIRKEIDTVVNSPKVQEQIKKMWENNIN